jgi:UDP-glucuronate 4-epimerase
VRLIEKEVGKEAKINWLPMQQGDVEVTFADIDKAKNLIGYKPGFPVEKGIRAFVDWYKKSKNGH